MAKVVGENLEEVSWSIFLERERSWPERRICESLRGWGRVGMYLRGCGVVGGRSRASRVRMRARGRGRGVGDIYLF